MDSVEFLPVEVTKPIMSLTVGDVLKMNIRTGRYELRTESEDIGNNVYSHEKFRISLEPWVIDKYRDYFQIYDEAKYAKEKYPLTPEECYKVEDCSSCDQVCDDEPCDGKSDTITELKTVLAEAKELYNKLAAELNK